MYGWVTHMHTHLRGACLHGCRYCYASRPMRGHPSKHLGALRLDASELEVRYGTDRTIFVEHQHDLFAANVPQSWIDQILDHCHVWPGNTYVLQTKNPALMLRNLYGLPRQATLGTTLETNRVMSCLISHAPPPRERVAAFRQIPRQSAFSRFVTIEPVMDFDEDVLASMVRECRPDWVNIGADSKGCRLPEPSAVQIRELVRMLRVCGIADIRLKANLGRILGPVWCRTCAVTPAECSDWAADGQHCADCARRGQEGGAL